MGTPDSKGGNGRSTGGPVNGSILSHLIWS